MNDYSPNRLPPEPGRLPAIVMAVIMHLALLGFLWIGISWQNKEVTAVEAEVWDLQVKDAAPKPVEVEAEEPKPEPVVKETPPEVKPQEKLEDPEIAIEQKKKLKEKQDAERKAELAEEKRKADEAEKLEKQKLAEKALDEKKKAEKLAADDAKKQAELKKQQAKEKAASDKIFADNMRRLTGQVAGSGGNGDAAKSTGNNRGDPSYAAKIGAKVRSNTVFNNADTSSANPTVEFRIELLPDGSLRGPVRKLKSSGVPAFDDAVEKAIEKSTPFPKNSAGVVPPAIDYVHRMKE
jgi:colicin import membrane protein